MGTKWRLRGSIIGACDCDHGCPCNFNVGPTNGGCEGVYVWAIDDGMYGDVDLSGLTMLLATSFPGAVHEGRGRGVYVVDERATPMQRKALAALQAGEGIGMPFEAFAKVTAQWLEPIYAPFDVKMDGIQSKVRVGGGRIYDLSMSRAKNPVTGREEEIYLDKPTGFTSKRSELGMSTVMKFRADGISFDNSGRYAEYGPFDYSGG